jgi:hypothetical protein
MKNEDMKQRFHMRIATERERSRPREGGEDQEPTQLIVLGARVGVSRIRRAA